jgi:chromosome partitioning protein
MNSFLKSWLTNGQRPRVVILGNEKGGSGKSTLAIHIVAGLLAAGFRVGSIDLDGRQGTLSRFLENRRRAKAERPEILLPQHRQVSLSRSATEDRSGDEKLDQVVTALEGLSDTDFIVVDTPGSDSVLCRAAHVFADILVTPLNPSYLDLDAMVEVDESAERIVGPSAYSELVLYMMEKRREMRIGDLRWVVVLNRLPNVNTKVTRSVTQVLEELVPRLGFRLAEGIHDRVVFRELFLQGLTVFDGVDRGVLRLANRGLRHGLKEMRDLLATLQGDDRPSRATTPIGNYGRTEPRSETTGERWGRPPAVNP